MILVVGLSPAWQRTLEFESFSVGEVNRAQQVTVTASGKGVNVARVAKALGTDVRLLTVAGGQRGELLAQSLRAQRISARIVRVAAETRVCQTVLANGVATELVEENGPLSRVEVGEVLKVFRSELAQARMLVLVGTVPPGCGENFYARLVKLAAMQRVRVFVDAQKGQLLNAIRKKPFLVRVNRQELAAATGLARVDAAARRLLRRGVEWVVISRGPGAVEVFHKHEQWSVKPPKVKAVNPIGSGDSMLAGIACALVQGQPMADAMRLGVACGAANALTETSGVVRTMDVRRLLRQIRKVGY